MKLPRDIGGSELASLLGKYGYHVTRQTGSHLRLTSTYKVWSIILLIQTQKMLFYPPVFARLFTALP